MEPAIVVENVSKKYSRNSTSHLNYGLSDLFNELMARSSGLELRKDEFLAVDHVSFYLQEADSLALIGRNGCGKSTILKMLTGLIKPDTGMIRILGRVQALINLGAGFNPNLSGRDNVYNSAALMGMSKRETDSVFNEILEFSELEDFISSPLYTYSSGMSARLGFSVAVHLKPDILLIDEILAVGDYAFQNKCFHRMQELKRKGVTIIVVSHNPTHVLQLCEHAIWLHRGRIQSAGSSKRVLQDYLRFLDEEQSPDRGRSLTVKDAKTHDVSNVGGGVESAVRESPYGPLYLKDDFVSDLSVDLLLNGQETNRIPIHSRVQIHYQFFLRRRVENLNVTLTFFREDGFHMTAISTLNGDLLRNIHEGWVEGEVEFPDFHFAPGHYYLLMPVHEGKGYLYRNIVKEFAVIHNGSLTWGITDLPYNYKVRKSDEKSCSSA